MTSTLTDPRTKTQSYTSGIQEMIDALPPEGGEVLLPVGVFPISRSIRPRTGVTLRGQGAATVIKPVAPYHSMLTRTTPPGPNAVEVEDAGSIQIGDEISLLEPYIPGLGRRGGYHTRILRVTAINGNRIEGTPMFGPPELDYRIEQRAYMVRAFPIIYVTDAHDVTIASLAIDGGIEKTLYIDERPVIDFLHAAVLVGPAKRCRVQDLTIQRCFADGICTGDGSSDAFVTGCVVEHCRGIGLHPGGGIKGAVFSHNISRYNDTGFLFCQGNRHVICSNNLVSYNVRHGIWGLDANDRYCMVVNNVSHHNGGHGIEATNCGGDVIQGNICRNNSQSQPGAFAGIYLKNHRDTFVTGNYCIDDQEKPTQLHGIQSVDPGEGNRIEGNFGA